MFQRQCGHVNPLKNDKNVSGLYYISNADKNPHRGSEYLIIARSLRSLPLRMIIIVITRERARSASGLNAYDTNTYQYYLFVMIMILKTSVCDSLSDTDT